MLKITSKGLLIVSVCVLFLSQAAVALAVTTTIVGSLGDLDGSGDSTGEDALVQAVAACWDARITTTRNFTLNVVAGNLTGGTLGTGATSAVDGSNIPITGGITMDNSSRTWVVDTTPIDSLEFTPDPNSQWRFINGPGPGSELYSATNHEVGHAHGWLSRGTGQPLTIRYDNLQNNGPGSYVANPTCAGPWPLRPGQPASANCETLVWNDGAGDLLNIPLRGDGLGGSGSSVVNELSHPGIGGDLMLGLTGGGVRETQSIEDLDMFQHAFGDTVNFPLTVNAGPDQNSVECDAKSPSGATVALDGTGSTDPENDSITYSWACDGGVTLSNAGTATPSGFFPLDQNVTCRLDATDLTACPADADTVAVTVVDTTNPTINCPAAIQVECSAAGGNPASDTAIDNFLTGATASDVCDPSVTDLSITNDAPGFFPNGVTTSVEFSTTDDSLNSNMCSASVEVVDTTPPVINSASAEPNVLWPPNHKKKEVTVSVDVTDVCDSDLTDGCMITGVTSNEPINGLGDGDKAPDWKITGDLTVKLRAERSGTGDGRIYTVEVTCSDDDGNSSVTTVDVSVPHNQPE